MIRNKEWVHLDYKKELSIDVKKELSKYFAAFSNTEGGLLVLGIDNNGTTTGCEVNDEEKNFISQQAAECHPPINIQLEERRYDDKNIVLIYSTKSKNIHSDKNHRFPVRIGSTIHHLDITGLVELLKERYGLTYKYIKTRPFLEFTMERWYFGSSEEDYGIYVKNVGNETAVNIRGNITDQRFDIPISLEPGNKRPIYKYGFNERQNAEIIVSSTYEDINGNEYNFGPKILYPIFY